MSPWKRFESINVRDYEARHPTLFSYVKEQMNRPDKQFLLIGDIHHHHHRIQSFLSSPDLAALFKHAAIPHVCLEMEREFIRPYQQAEYRAQLEAYKNGDITETEMRQLEIKLWSGIPHNSQMIGFTHANIEVTAADSLQWRTNTGFVPDTATRAFLGDREVSAYIKKQSQDKKTAVIYGAGHFRYDDTLSTRLGLENCVYIEIFASKEEYLLHFREGGFYTDTLPDQVYFLAETKLEKPDPALYHIGERNNDDGQRFRQNIIKNFSMNADPHKKEAATAKIKKWKHIDPDYFHYRP